MVEKMARVVKAEIAPGKIVAGVIFA